MVPVVKVLVVVVVADQLLRAGKTSRYDRRYGSPPSCTVTRMNAKYLVYSQQQPYCTTSFLVANVTFETLRSFDWHHYQP